MELLLLLGKLLVEELAELNVAKSMSTLCGLDFTFTVVEFRFCLGGPSETVTAVGLWISGAVIICRRLEVETVLARFAVSSEFPSCSFSFPIFRFGDGDLEPVIHDFLAKVANDSDRVLVLSRAALGV